MEWQQWDSVAFVDRKLVPTTSGIYVVADESDFVWYVGQATNLQSRWIGRSHHRYPQLIRTNKKLGHRIYWRSFPTVQLDEKERFFI
ncbi:MAG: GIY-YIG nuclease family protein, partial [Phormidesmis sp.]